MSTAKQATRNSKAEATDAAHRSQAADPGEHVTTGDDRLAPEKSGQPHRQGRGVDETGKDSRAPHSVK